MKFNLITALFLSLYSFSFAAWAAADPLLGTWKTIDDRTGYSLSDVVISKDKNNQYSAKIVSTRSVPGTAAQDTCIKCAGAQKNMPVIGMTMLSGLSADPAHQHEYTGGKMLDLNSGQHSAARARLMNSGKHLLIHSRADGAAVGRNLTWVKY
ncbi:DUF2147 domain-containing protein [Acinetobacter bouvetii]|jgi:hypothetical protein|uniref:DUF2147 domain-containing protein n=1 Tax=Acinetobacter bouvetii TaxID=202951 RepID=A0A4Q7B410_9GAMM|nr:DUF2147 domain-containing protein [Acinetobacter bouvetii]QXW25738.1 DUF2147 domain-containing protein [Acinetobacter johnsonii]RZG69949.1 DUF2147 domain-containing protein [Acinetobacter bouvetii]